MKGHRLSTGKLGATGFCWGGGMVNLLAVRIGADLDAGAPFYGPAPPLAEVGNIRAPLLIHYAENDNFVNQSRADYEAALKAGEKSYEMFSYPETRHGFHNNSTPRYHEAAANLAWERTVAFFKHHLG